MFHGGQEVPSGHEEKRHCVGSRALAQSSGIERWGGEVESPLERSKPTWMLCVHLLYGCAVGGWAGGALEVPSSPHSSAILCFLWQKPGAP